VHPDTEDLAVVAQRQLAVEVEMSRANPVEIRLPVLSSIHLTGRSSRMEARIEQTYPG